MLTKPQQLANQRLFSALFKKRGWEWDEAQLSHNLAKPHLRSLYLPIKAGNQPLFFKAKVLSGKRIGRLLRKEALLTEWLGERFDWAPRLVAKGEMGIVFWFARELADDPRGFVCEGEQVDRLDTRRLGQVMRGLDQLWSVKYEDLPEWRHRLVLTRENYSRPDIYFRKTILYSEILRPAQRKKELVWTPETDRLVMKVLAVMRDRLTRKELHTGHLVHGDLAPNNLYFLPDRAIFLDWEWSFWAVNGVIGWSLDVANFYTRLWQRPQLAEKFLTLTAKIARKHFADVEFSLNAAMVFSVLQKISPLYVKEVWKSKEGRNHFNRLVAILEKSARQLIDK